MKPFRTFLFFAAVALLMAFLALVIPEDGIPIGYESRLNFISFSELNVQDTLQEGIEQAEQLLAESGITEDPESDEGTDLLALSVEAKAAEAEAQASEKVDAGAEAITEPAEEQKPRVQAANVDSLKKAIHRIQFPEGQAQLLYPYFTRLDKIPEGRTRHTRILHFGDSQIENNRMTALIRYRLQKHFGGSGTGLIQAIPLYSRSLSYDLDESGDWLRYTYFGKRDSTINHKSYGIMGAFASVPYPRKDVWPYLNYSFNTARRSGKVSRMRIFMHSYVDSAAIALWVNHAPGDTLGPLPDGFGIAEYHHREAIEELELSFHFPEGGRIYGISFESSGGLQMDNIAMRGGSGLIFTSMDQATQEAMLNHLSPGLILLQYGGNVVPYMNARYYKRAFKRQLDFFKSVCPEAPILVIGPSDMSVRENGDFVTYPNLEKIRDALKSATLESGCGFWDLYEAMGGENSMATFVHADPPLASTDYVHFTGTGINLVAEMFYNALMLEYQEFEQERSRW